MGSLHDPAHDDAIQPELPRSRDGPDLCNADTVLRKCARVVKDRERQMRHRAVGTLAATRQRRETGQGDLDTDRDD
jgi:hypothetical protein